MEEHFAIALFVYETTDFKLAEFGPSVSRMLDVQALWSWCGHSRAMLTPQPAKSDTFAATVTSAKGVAPPMELGWLFLGPFHGSGLGRNAIGCAPISAQAVAYLLGPILK